MHGALPLIEPPLSGERSYVFAADILDAAIRLTGAGAGITLQLKRPCDCAIELVPGIVPEDADEVCGTFRCDDAGAVRRWWLRRRADRPIAERVGGPDDAVERSAEFGTDGARLAAGVAGTVAQRALFLAVLLLERERPDDYWRLAEWTAATAPPTDGALQAIVRQRIGGRFWRVEIAVDGAIWGHVMLARVID